ncbi:hypothetical protein J7K18_00155 [bacterium]|nr:hypothetical protein [bacterium]
MSRLLTVSQVLLLIFLSVGIVFSDGLDGRIRAFYLPSFSVYDRGSGVSGLVTSHDFYDNPSLGGELLYNCGVFSVGFSGDVFWGDEKPNESQDSYFRGVSFSFKGIYNFEMTESGELVMPIAISLGVGFGRLTYRAPFVERRFDATSPLLGLELGVEKFFYPWLAIGGSLGYNFLEYSMKEPSGEIFPDVNLSAVSIGLVVRGRVKF